MDGNNAFLAEMFAEGLHLGTKFSNVFRFNNKNIDISKLDLFEDDWDIVEMYLARRVCVDLVFVIMIYHFSEKINKQNLQIFANFGCQKVRRFAKEMESLPQFSDGAFEDILQKIKLELKGVVCMASA